jgi:hypothetical protein
MDETQGTLFDERFMGRHAGQIMSDPTTALVELVANSWDAYATKVDVTWPDAARGTTFSIIDNGIGMSRLEFETRWRTLDYNRTQTQGLVVQPPSDLKGSNPRQAYGRNGRGRHAAFFFSSPYRARTWRDGTEVTFRVSQGLSNPIEIRLVKEVAALGHGTEISAEQVTASRYSADEVRSILSTRFLLDPSFSVSVDGVKVSFADVPSDALSELTVVVGKDKARVIVIDSQKADRTTKQHGIAWWVNRRLVGTPSWQSFSDKFLDGRTEEAKRYSFVVHADFLAAAVTPDWSGFSKTDPKWLATQDAVNEQIRQVISGLLRERRDETKATVLKAHQSSVQSLPRISQDRWKSVLDELVEKCPNLGETQVVQVMGVLAAMELAQSQYSLLEKLHKFSPSDIDAWDELFTDWTIKTAKEALDEIAARLRLIEEIKLKTHSSDTKEVQELQPLFGKSLWIFGPQFESIEFTSNVSMTKVIKAMFGVTEKGSLNRPDFVARPDGSIGFYSRPAFDTQFNESGTDALVVIELKRPGVPLGDAEKGQAWKYIKELMDKGHVTKNTHVHAYVLGDSIDPSETGERAEGDRCIIRPMLYSVFIGQAEKRMMNLHKRLSEAPFMQAAGAADAEPVLFEREKAMGKL